MLPVPVMTALICEPRRLGARLAVMLASVVVRRPRRLGVRLRLADPEGVLVLLKGDISSPGCALDPAQDSESEGPFESSSSRNLLFFLQQRALRNSGLC